MAETKQINKYPGVNPHLNSYLQHKGWRGFHQAFLVDLTRHLEGVLPEGYIAATEQSLQIRTYDPEKTITSVSVADVAVYAEPRSGLGSVVVLAEPQTPTVTMPMLVELEEEDYVSSVVIFDLNEKPVTRIELLSPANKRPGGSHADQYLQKREETLRAGLRLVEIDLLHAQQPVLDRIPSYIDRHWGARPYMIIVTDPRPRYEAGMIYVYSWELLAPLPVINIPLEDKDVVTVNFNAVYQQTYASSRLFYALRTDYTREPVHFTTYDLPEREIILNKMSEIKAAAAKDND